jgi:hypothetical protein
VKKYGRAGQDIDDNIGRMHFACWITKATNTLRICNTYCFSTAQIVTRTPVFNRNRAILLISYLCSCCVTGSDKYLAILLMC